jgi:hypothetical protein
MQSTMEFQILGVDDPYACNTNAVTGLTGSKSGIVSVYRRPLPSANLGFLSTIMWDGREPDLFQQSVHATLGHAQANAALTGVQQQQIVTFEGGIFTAQIHDDGAAELTAAGANGGPTALATSVTKFFIGITTRLASTRPVEPSVRRFSTSTMAGATCRAGAARLRHGAPLRAASSSSTAFRSISPGWTD